MPIAINQGDQHQSQQESPGGTCNFCSAFALPLTKSHNQCVFLSSTKLVFEFNPASFLLQTWMLWTVLVQWRVHDEFKDKLTTTAQSTALASLLTFLLNNQPTNFSFPPLSSFARKYACVYDACICDACLNDACLCYTLLFSDQTSRPVLGVGLPNVATQNIFKLFTSKESEHDYSSPSVKKTTHKKSFIYCWADKPAADFSFRFLSWNF